MRSAALPQLLSWVLEWSSRGSPAVSCHRPLPPKQQHWSAGDWRSCAGRPPPSEGSSAPWGGFPRADLVAARSGSPPHLSWPPSVPAGRAVPAAPWNPAPETGWHPTGTWATVWLLLSLGFVGGFLRQLSSAAASPWPVGSSPQEAGTSVFPPARPAPGPCAVPRPLCQPPQGAGAEGAPSTHWQRFCSVPVGDLSGTSEHGPVLVPQGDPPSKSAGGRSEHCPCCLLPACNGPSAFLGLSRAGEQRGKGSGSVTRLGRFALPSCLCQPLRPHACCRASGHGGLEFRAWAELWGGPSLGSCTHASFVLSRHAGTAGPCCLFARGSWAGGRAQGRAAIPCGSCAMGRSIPPCLVGAALFCVCLQVWL